ncbi:hypothetical protein V1460_06320 [Streptomyces sp. SCSIO 30461]|uniref:hypothetical protein n=1 Tax=Streptomyces sp. SCSIO 30461 TaxID=3118085 RepID=UPI0030D50383
MSKQPVSAAQVPEFTGSLEQLERDVSAISGDASSIWSAGTDVDTAFRGLSSYYQAPEAEQLFAVTTPVATGANEFSDELESIARALGAYAGEVRPLVQKLERLKSEAAEFETRIAGDDEWSYDDALIDENNARRDEINAAYFAFQAAEIACANKIHALVSCFRYVPDNGDETRADNEYGYSLDMLNNAEGLPWGDRLDESIHWYELHRQVKHFVWDGLIIDFGVGTVRGIGTLFGADGSDAALQAWDNLGKIAVGLIHLTTPMALPYLATPDAYMPQYLRESRTALKEAGKAMVAWDQWGKDNARAAGATFGNVITTVFTGGAGTTLKGGAIARGISTAGKAARFIDPIQIAGTGMRFGTVKLGDALANLRMLHNGDYLRVGEGAYRLDNTPTPRAETAAFPPEKFEKLVDFDGNTIYAPKAGGHWLNPDGTLYKNTPAAVEGSHTQRAAAGQEPVPPREPALIGAGTRVGEVTAHTGGGLGQGAARGAAGESVGATRDLTSGRTGDTSAGQQTGHGSGSNGVPPRSGGSGGGLHGPGYGGDDALGTSGRPADDVVAGNDAGGDGKTTDRGPDGSTSPQQPAFVRPSHMHDGANPYGPRGSMTLEQIEEIQVYRANTDPDYFDRYYRVDGTRKDVELRDESGYTPPQLTRELDDGTRIRAQDAPAPPKPHYLDDDYVRVSGDAVTSDARRKILAGAAQDRHFAVQWNNLAEHWKAEAGEAHKAQGSFESGGLWGEAKGTYKEAHTHMGDKAEAFGEAAARHHYMAEHYPGFEEQALLGPKNGNDQFDQVWLHEDGRAVVIEAKSSPGTELGSRTLPKGRQVSQGSREYFLDIIRVMEKRGELETVKALEAALAQGKLEYVVVKGGKNSGTYNGLLYRRFDISKGTLP